jgi:hypothetical protein
MILDIPSNTVHPTDTHSYCEADLLQMDTPMHSDSPPAYESAIAGTSVGAPLVSPSSQFTILMIPSASSPKDAGPQSTQPKGPPLMVAGPPQPTYGATASEATVYHYQDPHTGLTVASLLPPDHPQMVCLQAGQHVPESRYGFLGAFVLCFTSRKSSWTDLVLWLCLFCWTGVLAAIVWFPLGIGLCLLDRRVRCQRCGESIEDGICS